ncbi:hypothetical protein [Umezakia ovalisporum]|jgi:hypothetical protein|uniref:Uncharacterized protein n=1 Tax=Umezakia ovalisporum FSS-62 TaxID=2971776 RepID=A0AA43GVV7_9CYAN|nr:hypothetical protein [Umezakia ovalisporum]MDH6062605.1 hypothetical protein [Umezakia ovalisporum FSS-62]
MDSAALQCALILKPLQVLYTPGLTRFTLAVQPWGLLTEFRHIVTTEKP